jgi:hypothetical protein
MNFLTKRDSIKLADGSGVFTNPAGGEDAKH